MIPHTSESRSTRQPSRGGIVCRMRGLKTNAHALSARQNTRVIPYRETFSEFCTRYFVEEKVDLTMSKGSLMGLVLGLMLLGILFFLSGFLAAVHLYTPSSSIENSVPIAHDPLNSPYHLPTQPTYATSSSSRMPTSSGHLPTTQQRMVVVPPSRHPSDYVMKPPYTTSGESSAAQH